MPWSLLGILLAVCAVMCAVGFYKFVYFLSIGYGFAIAGGGIAVLVMYLVNPTNTPVWIVLVECALFIAYGVRLSGFLLVRELKNVSFRKTDVAKDTLAKNNEKKMPVFVLATIWVIVQGGIKILRHGLCIHKGNRDHIDDSIQQQDHHCEDHLFTKIFQGPSITQCFKHLNHLGLSACLLDLFLSRLRESRP